MKKSEIRTALLNGAALEDILTLSDGQECEIFKGSFFAKNDEVIYIPDTTLNDIPTHRPVTDEECNHILSHCYTKEDFLRECNDDAALAFRLFRYVDWQHPSSAFVEVDYEDEEDQRQAAEIYRAACEEVKAA